MLLVEVKILRDPKDSLGCHLGLPCTVVNVNGRLQKSSKSQVNK